MAGTNGVDTCLYFISVSEYGGFRIKSREKLTNPIEYI
jgi:hypothetical protein